MQQAGIEKDVAPANTVTRYWRQAVANPAIAV